MTTSGWQSDEGWPYADPAHELADPVNEPDWDVLAVHADRDKLFACLDEKERAVVMARFGMDGGEAQSMKEIRRSTGLDHTEARLTLGSAIAKMRACLEEHEPEG